MLGFRVMGRVLGRSSVSVVVWCNGLLHFALSKSVAWR